MLYSNELRPQIREKNPDLKITEVAKVIGQKWNDMPEEDKKVSSSNNAIYFDVPIEQ